MKCAILYFCSSLSKVRFLWCLLLCITHPILSMEKQETSLCSLPQELYPLILPFDHSCVRTLIALKRTCATCNNNLDDDSVKKIITSWIKHEWFRDKNDPHANQTYEKAFKIFAQKTKTSYVPIPMYPLHHQPNAWMHMIIDLFLLTKINPTGTLLYEKTGLLHAMALYNDTGRAEYLLKLGIDPNEKDSQGNSPLHSAAKYFQCEMVVLLLKHGANAEAKNNENHTPIDALFNSNDTCCFYKDYKERRLKIWNQLRQSKYTFQ